MIRMFLAAGAATLALAAAPAAAQSMSGMQMPGMDMSKPMQAKKKAPAKKAPPKKKQAHKAAPHKPAAAKAVQTATPAAKDAMPGMDMSGRGDMSGMDISGGGMAGMNMSGQQQTPAQDQSMPGMDHGAMPGMQMTAPSGTNLPAGHAPAPPPPTGHYADRDFPVAAMNRARKEMMHEEGGRTFYQVMFNLAEVQVRGGRDGYRWDGEAWVGGDIDRLVLKSEGEGSFRRGLDTAEAQALYSHAIGPYYNLQAGIRHDFQPSPTRTYATVGIEGLAPYMFETEAALFLSTKGDVLARAEGWYDERITQRLILQPRVELNFAAQDVPEDRIGAGLTDAELGLRLRYEIKREFAPYIGVSYEAKTGRTATFARRDGDSAHATSLVLGIRTWF
jgi:copper resistance protein B